MTDYEKQAEEFLKETDTKLELTYMGHFSRFTETPTANWRFVLTRGHHKLEGVFSQSIANSYKIDDLVEYSKKYLGKKLIDVDFFMWGRTQIDYDNNILHTRKFGSIKIKPCKDKPTAYQILTCLQTYDVGSYADFCKDFNYEGSEHSLKLWMDICNEYRTLTNMYSEEELSKLAEIQ